MELPKDPAAFSQQCGSCDNFSACCWCVDCNEALCDTCLSAHRRVKLTRSHQILSQLPAGAAVSQPTKYCKLHSSEPLKLFCFTCNQFTCRDCQLINHMNHRYMFIKEALDSLKKQMEVLFLPVSEKQEAVRQSLKNMEIRLQDIAESEERLKAQLQNSHRALAQQMEVRMQEILKKIKEVSTSETSHVQMRIKKLKQLQEDLRSVSENKERARSTSNLSEMLCLTRKVRTQLSNCNEDTSPPNLMSQMLVTVQDQTLQSILKFGELQVSWVPFSVTPASSQNTVAISYTSPPTANSESLTAIPIISSSAILPVSTFTPSKSSGDELTRSSQLVSLRSEVDPVCPSFITMPAISSGSVPKAVQPLMVVNKQTAHPVYQPAPPVMTKTLTVYQASCFSQVPVLLSQNGSKPASTWSYNSVTSKEEEQKNYVNSKKLPVMDTGNMISLIPQPPVQQVQKQTTGKQPMLAPKLTPGHQPLSTHRLQPGHQPLSTHRLQPGHQPLSTHRLQPGHQPLSTHRLQPDHQPLSTHRLQLGHQLKPIHKLTPDHQPTPAQKLTTDHQATSAQKLTPDPQPMPAHRLTPDPQPMPAHRLTPDPQPVPTHKLKPDHHLMLTHKLTPDHHLMLTHKLTPDHRLMLTHKLTPDHHPTPAQKLTPDHQPTSAQKLTPDPQPMPVHRLTPDPQPVPTHRLTPDKQPVPTHRLTPDPQPVPTHKLTPDQNTLSAHKQTSVPQQLEALLRSQDSELLPTEKIKPDHQILRALLRTPVNEILPTQKPDHQLLSTHKLTPDQPPLTDCQPAQIRSLDHQPLPAHKLTTDHQPLLDQKVKPELQPLTTNKQTPEHQELHTPEPPLLESETSTGIASCLQVSPQQPLCDIRSCSSSVKPLQSNHIVKAVADSACDISIQRVTQRQQEPAENEPTSTVSKEPEPEPELEEKPPTPASIDTDTKDPSEASSEDRNEDPSKDPSSVVGWPDSNLGLMQPVVSLYRLPLGPSCPGSPFPSFRLVPGDADDEIYLEEISEDSESHTEDFTSPLSSPECPLTLQVVSCSACRSANASIICSACGRGYHRDCHIPPVGPDIWSEWNCSLCQGLTDPSDPSSSNRLPQKKGLSLPDQRRCESLLLYLKVEGCSLLPQSRLKIMTERLTIHRPSAYQTSAELLYDIWKLFKDAAQDDDSFTKLQESFQDKVSEIFSPGLYPAVLNLPSTSCHTQAHKSCGEDGEQEVKRSKVMSQEPELDTRNSKLSELKRRLRDFMDISGSPKTKKRRMDT